jgi:hypothetical protein
MSLPISFLNIMLLMEMRLTSASRTSLQSLYAEAPEYQNRLCRDRVDDFPDRPLAKQKIDELRYLKVVDRDLVILAPLVPNLHPLRRDL